MVDQSSPAAASSESSPFATGSLLPEELEAQSRTFLTLFGAAVEAETTKEEAWAYGKMTETFRLLMGDPAIEPRHNLPLGLWGAMKWAARMRVAEERRLTGRATVWPEPPPVLPRG